MYKSLKLIKVVQVRWLLNQYTNQLYFYAPSTNRKLNFKRYALQQHQKQQVAIDKNHKTLLRDIKEYPNKGRDRSCCKYEKKSQYCKDISSLKDMGVLFPDQRKIKK